MHVTLDDETEVEIQGESVRRVADDSWTETVSVLSSLAVVLEVSEQEAALALERAMIARGAVHRTRSIQFKPTGE